MPKIIRRAAEVVKGSPGRRLANGFDAREPVPALERQVRYAQRQADRGQTQIKIWVPNEAVPWVHQLARDMRALASQGYDPFTAYQHMRGARKLPEGLLKVPS